LVFQSEKIEIQQEKKKISTTTLFSFVFFFCTLRSLVAVEASEFLLKGWLLKEGDFRNFNRRFFCLTTLQLSFHFDEHSPPLGVMGISSMTSLVVKETRKTLQNFKTVKVPCIKISLNDRKPIFITSDNVKDLDDWMAAINQQIIELSKKRRQMNYRRTMVLSSSSPFFGLLAKLFFSSQEEMASEVFTYHPDFSGKWELAHKESDSLEDLLKHLGR
jgi:hypothetical protein